MLEPWSNPGGVKAKPAAGPAGTSWHYIASKVLLRLARNAPRAALRSFIASSIALVLGLAITGCLIAGTLFTLRTINPPTSMLMLGERLMGREVTQRWVPISGIARALQRAVVLSEDGQFCRHHGVDLNELRAAAKRVEAAQDVEGRGASTITMQVAKNLFLWPQRSLVRKGLEVGLALAIEKVWSKQRILEVYLNIAEWGPGIFGAEAAAREHFRKSASRLTETEALLLAVSLPNPKDRVAGHPGPGTRKLAGLLDQRIKQSGLSHTACLE